MSKRNETSGFDRTMEVARLFLRLGFTGFGGPAAHIALIERECVQRRGWLSRESFVDLLGAANLIPGPTSTELAMHVGRHHAGWAGLVVAGIAFIVPAALLVGILAAVYVRADQLPVTQRVLAGVAPVVIVLIVQAIGPLARTAVRSAALLMVAVAAAVAALAGLAEIYALLAAGVIYVVFRLAIWGRALVVVVIVAAAAVLHAQPQATSVDAPELFTYFLRVGSMLFGSGYVLLPVLEGDLVERLGWLTERQLIDAVAAGQVTPGPVFTTATFVGYLLGGPWMAAAATVGMFVPAFVFSALSSLVLERLRRSRVAGVFLDGVNAAAVALIAVVVWRLAETAFVGWLSVLIAAIAAAVLFGTRVHPTLVLVAAALGGALWPGV